MTIDSIFTLLMFFKIIIPFVIAIIFISSFLKTKKIETKRFRIIKLIDDIKRAMLHSKDDILKQEITIIINTIIKRINDFTTKTIAAGELWSFFLIGTVKNRQYHLINNELEEHLETLIKIKALLPKPLI